jgi:hypothetical protein
VDVATYLYEIVQAQIHTMAKAEQKLQTANKSKYYTAFCLGATHTISTRLKAQQETQQNTNAACTALVVVSDEQLRNAVIQFFPRLTKGRTMRASHADGYERGKAAGHTVTMNRGVGASGYHRRISS